MIDNDFLLAVNALPEVGAPLLRRRDGILRLVASAEDLRKRAALIEGQAQQAYTALERRVYEIWTPEEVSAARVKGGRHHAAR